jgi:hypothetical protein
MKAFITMASCLAIGVAAIAHSAQAQGPVRQGLRRTGEIAAEGTRRVVEGAADVTRGVVRGTAQGLRAGVDALTPATPWQAQAGANLSAADQGRDARWRFQRRNGEWWYYTPEGTWMYHRDGQWNQFAAETFQPQQQPMGQQFADQRYGGEYQSGYRGLDQQAQYGQQGQYAQPGANQPQGPVHRLYVDRYGREFICENGRRVYVSPTQGGVTGQEYGVGYRGMEGTEGQKGAQLQPTPAAPEQPGGEHAEHMQSQPPSQPAQPQGALAQPQGEAQGVESEQPAAPATIRNEPAPSQTGQPGTSGATPQ